MKLARPEGLEPPSKLTILAPISDVAMPPQAASEADPALAASTPPGSSIPNTVLMPHVTLTPQQVVARLAGIRYPPDPRAARRADDAAFLLLAKDQLTVLASPARGLTIAYTSLFSGLAGMGGIPRWLRWFRPQTAPDDFATSSPGALVESAFPGLSGQVRKFNAVFLLLLLCTMVSLLLTAITYWDVALGRSHLLRIDSIHKQRAAIYETVPALVGDAYKKECESPATPAADRAFNCNKLKDLSVAEEHARKDLGAYRECAAIGCYRIFHVMHWEFLLSGVRSTTIQDPAQVAALLSLFGNYILPMMFGVLGTFIAAIRIVQAKVRESVLSPRDLWSTLLALPLGMVAGVAVGLYFSPTSAPETGGAGNTLAGNLTMSASGLGFIAGYGSQAFFTMLDSLLIKAFPANGEIARQKP